VRCGKPPMKNLVMGFQPAGWRLDERDKVHSAKTLIVVRRFFADFSPQRADRVSPAENDNDDFGSMK
jgi:hypothetical protein